MSSKAFIITEGKVEEFLSKESNATSDALERYEKHNKDKTFNYYLYKIGVKLRDDNGNFRNIKDVLDDIVHNIYKLSEKEKKEMCKAAATMSVNNWYRKDIINEINN